MTHLRHRDLGEILVPTPDAAFEPLNWPKAGAYPLFPYHNRVKGAAFEHDGKHIALVPHPALGTDTIHGPAHRRPWKVENASKNAANLVLDYAADEDWPFDFRAGQGFRLFPDRLEITLALINTGNSPMPGGLGWHPYFATSRMRRAETDACLRWPTDEIGLPIGGAEARRATRLAASDFTEHFSAWSEASAEVDAGGLIPLDRRDRRINDRSPRFWHPRLRDGNAAAPRKKGRPRSIGPAGISGSGTAARKNALQD